MNKIYVRGILVWLVIVFSESVHGILRRFILEPWIGDIPARQISVFTGSAIILAIALILVKWMRAHTLSQLIRVGLLWAVLTISFEIAMGRGVFKYSWVRIFADYDLSKGGLLGFWYIVSCASPVYCSKIATNYLTRRYLLK